MKYVRECVFSERSVHSPPCRSRNEGLSFCFGSWWLLDRNWRMSVKFRSSRDQVLDDFITSWSIPFLGGAVMGIRMTSKCSIHGTRKHPRAGSVKQPRSGERNWDGLMLGHWKRWARFSFLVGNEHGHVFLCCLYRFAWRWWQTDLNRMKRKVTNTYIYICSYYCILLWFIMFIISIYIYIHDSACWVAHWRWERSCDCYIFIMGILPRESYPLRQRIRV